jgi:hypothetical protein
MNPLTEPKPTMSDVFLHRINAYMENENMVYPKTSFETCKIEFHDTNIVFYAIEKRPIYNKSKGYLYPESYNKDKNIVTTWYHDRVVKQYNNEGFTKTWYYRPTIQDVFDGHCGYGCCVKFNSNGSIYMNWIDGITWYYGPLIDGEYEHAYDTYNSDDEQYERCPTSSCECRYGRSM